MSEGKYMPSPEEVKKAEDMMVPIEKSTSENREFLGEGGYLEEKTSKPKPDQECRELIGRIKGHDVKFRRLSGYGYELFEGEVDGYDVGAYAAEDLYKKYGYKSTSWKGIEKQIKEQRPDAKERIKSALKDLLE